MQFLKYLKKLCQAFIKTKKEIILYVSRAENTISWSKETDRCATNILVAAFTRAYVDVADADPNMHVYYLGSAYINKYVSILTTAGYCVIVKYK